MNLDYNQTNPEMVDAYLRADHDLRKRYSTIAVILCILLVLAGATLDWYVFSEYFWSLFYTRLIFDAIIIGFLIAIFTPLVFYIKQIAVAATLMTSLAVSWMIGAVGGVDSSYYAGLILILVGTGVLMPLTLAEIAIVSVGTIVMYATACLLHAYTGGILPDNVCRIGPDVLGFVSETGACLLPGATQIESLNALLSVSDPDFSEFKWAIFYNNLYFLISTSILCMTASYFQSRNRIQEFCLSYELEVRNNELAELDRVKSEFFANISHEFRTPLTLILAPIEDLLSKRQELPERVVDLLGIARQNGLRLLKLVNDLLEVIRLEEGKIELRSQYLELNGLVKEMVGSMRQLAQSQNIELSYQLSEDQPLVVCADESALEKVLTNIIGNAIKFTEQGGCVEVKTFAQDGDVILSVTDNGIGIKPEDIKHIFDRFRQADSSITRKYQGSGLGLALVKELTERQGGRVWVESEYGKGTTMYIRIPQWQGSEEDIEMGVPLHLQAKSRVPDALENIHKSADQTAAFSVQNSTIDGRRIEQMAAGQEQLQERLTMPQAIDPKEYELDDSLTVLVVDDEPDMRHYLVQLLSDNYNVLYAQDGQQGLDMVYQYLPDLVVLDLMLPIMDGLEVCRQIKLNDATRDVKVMLLTARADEASKIRALEIGADDFLTKPFGHVEVKIRVRNLLQAASLQKFLRQRNQETLAQLQQTEKHVMQSEKLSAIGGLAAGLVHEINNPVNFTLMALTTIMQELQSFDDPKSQEIISEHKNLLESIHIIKEAIDDASEGTRRVRDIVSDLKTFAHPGDADVSAIFQFTKALETALRFTAHERRHIQLDYDLVSEHDYVRGSLNHVVQVLINLLTNAVKATNKQTERKPRIKISTQSEQKRLYIHVWDNGVGMDEQQLNQVFEPFVTTGVMGESTGLGLSICRTIVQNHGGDMIVKSEKNAWTQFTFDLRLVDEPTQTLPTPSPPPPLKKVV